MDYIIPKYIDIEQDSKNLTPKIAKEMFFEILRNLIKKQI